MNKPTIYSADIIELIRQYPDMTTGEISNRFPIKRYRSTRANHHDMGCRLAELTLRGKLVRTSTHPSRWRVAE